MSSGIIKHLNSHNDSQMSQYLTNNPEISFFKYSIKKYSNFSIEAKNLQPENKIRFGHEFIINIQRHGDMFNNLYLNLNIKAKCNNKKWGCIKNIGYNIIEYVEFYIGNNLIDVMYSDWIGIWNELTLNKNYMNGYNELIGNKLEYTNIMKDIENRNIELIIPISFFFNKKSGLSLPLISLQYMETNLKFKLRNFEDCINTEHKFTNSDWDIQPTINGNLIVDYIFLDNAERLLFSKYNNEILIEQHYKIPPITLNSNNNYYNEYLDFYNLTKSLYWTITLDKFTNKSEFLGENIEKATKRFIIIALFGTQKDTIKLNDNILAGTIFKIQNDNTIGFYNKNGELYNLGNKTKLNSTYLYYSHIKEVFENCIIVKDLNLDSLTDDVIDLSFIEINKYLDNFTYSLEIKNLIINSNNDIYKPFEILNRSIISGGISLKKYDIKLIDYNNYGLYLDNNTDTLETLKINFDGNDRTDVFDSKYYNLVQPYIYHSNMPPKGIYMYSFSLNPEDYQPSGTVNFSIINNIEFKFNINKEINNSNTAKLNVFSINYNLLRILNGSAGLTYSK